MLIIMQILISSACACADASAYVRSQNDPQVHSLVCHHARAWVYQGVHEWTGVCMCWYGCVRVCICICMRAQALCPIPGPVPRATRSANPQRFKISGSAVEGLGQLGPFLATGVGLAWCFSQCFCSLPHDVYFCSLVYLWWFYMLLYAFGTF